MRTVKEYMTPKVITVAKNMPVRSIIPLFLKHEISSVPVVNEDGEILGFITEGDVLYQVKLPEIAAISEHEEIFFDPKPLIRKYRKMGGKTAEQIMTTEVISIERNATIESLIDLMLEKHVKSVPVLSGKKIVGIISRIDVMKFLLEEESELEKYTLSDSQINEVVSNFVKKGMNFGINDLHVSTSHGVVHLSGEIESKESIELLKELVHAVRGVKEVTTNFVVTKLLH